MPPCGASSLRLGEGEPDDRGLGEVVEDRVRGSASALYSAVPSVISTTSPPGLRISSGSAWWLVIRCVSSASRRSRRPVVEVVLPHRRVPLEEVLGAPDVVDEHVEAALLGVDALDERARPARGRGGRRRPRCPSPPAAVTSSAVSSIVSGRSTSERLLARAAAGAVDGRARLAERDGDAAAGAAGGAGDERDHAATRPAAARRRSAAGTTAASTSAPPSSCSVPEPLAEHERTRARRSRAARRWRGSPRVVGPTRSQAGEEQADRADGRDDGEAGRASPSPRRSASPGRSSPSSGEPTISVTAAPVHTSAGEHARRHARRRRRR